MSRLMSVALTEASVRARAKTVTRRTGWQHLKVGETVTLCRKVMGRRTKAGVEPLVRIVDVEVVSMRRERLASIDVDDVAREGLAPMTPAEFVAFFCRTHKGCTPDTEVTRIEWCYLDANGDPEDLVATTAENLDAVGSPCLWCRADWSLTDGRFAMVHEVDCELGALFVARLGDSLHKIGRP